MSVRGPRLEFAVGAFLLLALASLLVLALASTNGKFGFVPSQSILPIVTDQLCYIKDAGGWKITGYAGGS